MATETAIRGLYVITDDRHDTTAQLVERVGQAIAGGARTVQYRAKDVPAKTRCDEAAALKELCCRHKIPLIINDDIELAQQIGADGVHLGRDDMPLLAARQQLGEQALIGISCYNRLDTAISAQRDGADYVAFGSFFPSPTKPGAVTAPLTLLQQAQRHLSLPIVAIGGITAGNGANLISAGATALAVVSGVFAGSDIRSAAAAYARLFAVPE